MITGHFGGGVLTRGGSVQISASGIDVADKKLYNLVAEGEGNGYGAMMGLGWIYFTQVFQDFKSNLQLAMKVGANVQFAVCGVPGLVGDLQSLVLGGQVAHISTFTFPRGGGTVQCGTGGSTLWDGRSWIEGINVAVIITGQGFKLTKVTLTVGKIAN